jgi:hypothetical protein
MSDLTITHAGNSVTQLRPGMTSTNQRLNEMKTKVFSITPTTATAEAGTDEVIFQADELSNFMSVKGGTAIIQSITLLDDNDFGETIELLFMEDDSRLDGTVDAGSAIDGDDTVGSKILGVVTVSNYFDGVSWKFGQKENIGLAIKAVSTTRSVWLSAVNRGTARDWDTNGLHLKIGYIQD